MSRLSLFLGRLYVLAFTFYFYFGAFVILALTFYLFTLPHPRDLPTQWCFKCSLVHVLSKTDTKLPEKCTTAMSCLMSLLSSPTAKAAGPGIPTPSTGKVRTREKVPSPWPVFLVGV